MHSGSNKPLFLEGVYSNGLSSGIKKNGNKDLGVLFVPEAVGSAGVFTKNTFAASSVKWTKRRKQSLKAVIVNSGNANACTGDEGKKHTQIMANALAKELGISSSQVGVASTGIIGVALPIEKIKKGIHELAQSSLQQEGSAFLDSIITTDLTKKSVTRHQKIGDNTLTITGVVKGSGMIAPNMATMLGFLVTNAALSSQALQTCLQQAVDDSFNCLSVDTDTSTNDLTLLFATGKTPIPECNVFQSLLTEVCIELATLIAKDGEGATRFIHVEVKGAKTRRQARLLAKSVVDSPLVKTAVHGADPNWGRVAAALGKSRGFLPNEVSIAFNQVSVFEKGYPLHIDRSLVSKAMSTPNVHILVTLRRGHESASAFGCDLTKGYIDINTAYS